jgi:DNA-binding NtrC family response regulator
MLDDLRRHEADAPQPEDRQRVIASTSEAIDVAIEDGMFLEDLYYYLSDQIIRVPSLRHRSEDVEPLCEHFLAGECRKLGYRRKHLSPRSLDLLTGYGWPGNVAQLEALIRTTVATALRLVIRPRDLPESIGMDSETRGDLNLKQLEREQIAAALKQAAGNKSRAAKLLGIGRSSLHRKLDQMRRGALEHSPRADPPGRSSGRG